MIATAAYQKMATMMIHELPTEIYQEIAYYLPKSDIDNFRLTCTDTSSIFYPRNKLTFVSPTPQPLDGYYCRVTHVICKTTVPSAGNMTFLDVSKLATIDEIINALTTIEVIYVSYTQAKDCYHIILPRLYGVGCYARMKSYCSANYVINALCEGNPGITHLYIDGCEITKKIPEGITVIHTSGYEMSETLPTSLRVFSTNRCLLGNQVFPNVHTLIGSLSSMHVLHTMFPALTTMIEMTLTISQGVTAAYPFDDLRGIKRLAVNSCDMDADGVDVITSDDDRVTDWFDRNDYRSIDSIMRR